MLSIRLAHSTAMVVFLLALSAIILLPEAKSEVREWHLVDRDLHSQATAALLRYYAIVRPDSAHVRYILKNSSTLGYLLRAELTTDTAQSRLVSISIGQLSLFSVSELRIAFGEEVYAALLASRSNPLSSQRGVPSSLSYQELFIPSDATLEMALDKVRWSFDSGEQIYVSAGAPESNLFWWSDATFRVGISNASTAFEILLPFAGGASAVGPVRSRQLLPAFGLAASVRHERLEGFARFSLPMSSTMEGVGNNWGFAHTGSGHITYTVDFPLLEGSLEVAGGVGFEEFTQFGVDSGEVQSHGSVQRLSPIANLSYEAPGANLRLTAGIADLALRGSMSLRLTTALSFGLEWVSNSTFRDARPFESTFNLFLTPRISF